MSKNIRRRALRYGATSRHNGVASRQRPMPCLKCNSFYYNLLRFGFGTEILSLHGFT